VSWYLREIYDQHLVKGICMHGMQPCSLCHQIASSFKRIVSSKVHFLFQLWVLWLDWCIVYINMGGNYGKLFFVSSWMTWVWVGFVQFSFFYFRLVFFYVCIIKISSIYVYAMDELKTVLEQVVIIKLNLSKILIFLQLAWIFTFKLAGFNIQVVIIKDVHYERSKA